MRWRAVVGIAAVAAAVAALGAGSAAAATTWTVDQTTGNDALCPATKVCKTIQAAINFAAPGDTIVVHHGVYEESPVVNKALTLRGQTRASLITGCSPTTPYSAAQDTVIHHSPGGGPSLFSLDIESSNVTITGFVIRDSITGILIANGPKNGSFSGISITQNVIQENQQGIWLDFNGSAPNLIQGNCFRLNQFATYAGWPNGAVQNVSISSNKFRKNPVVSVLLAGHNQDGVQVTGNLADGDGIFFLAFRLTNFQLTGNIANNLVAPATPEQAAVYLGGDVTSGTIQGNIFNKGTRRGFVFDRLVPTANSNLTIVGNVVGAYAGNGMEATAGALKNSTITGNITKVTGVNGLLLAGGNTGNSFAGNIFQGKTWGCHVLGSSIALNNWNGSSNIGTPMNTPGTCFP